MTEEIRFNIVIGNIICIGIFICILPMIFNWDISPDNMSFTSSYPLLRGLLSKDYMISLVSGVAISIPLLFDYIFDFIFLSNKLVSKSHLIRGILLVGLLVPDLLILLVVIPSKNLSALVVIWGIRGIICPASILYHIYQQSKAFIKCYYFGFAIAIITATETFLCLLSFTHNRLIFLYTIYPFATLFFSITFSLIVFKIFSRIRLEYKRNGMQVYHYDIVAHLGALFIVGVGVFILSIYFGPVITVTKNTTYLSMYTYMLTSLTSIILILQSRLLRVESIIINRTLELKRNFVRFASHEIRSPLNTVSLGLKLLKSELNHDYTCNIKNSNKQLQELTQIVLDIEESANIAIFTLDELLMYEKLDSGILQLECTELRASTFLLQALHPFVIQARQCGITLDLRDIIDSTGDHNNNNIHSRSLYHTFLYADKHRLQQVIRNLLSNALKFTQSGGLVTVTATVLPWEAGLVRLQSKLLPFMIDSKLCEQYLKLEVTDTGPGIAKENLNKLFKGIVQFSPSKLQNGGGSGFGLWISHQIMELHHGSMSVYSEGEGKGSTFSIHIPILQEKPFSRSSRQGSVSGDGGGGGGLPSSSVNNIDSHRESNSIHSDSISSTVRLGLGLAGNRMSGSSSLPLASRQIVPVEFSIVESVDIDNFQEERRLVNTAPDNKEQDEHYNTTSTATTLSYSNNTLKKTGHDNFNVRSSSCGHNNTTTTNSSLGFDWRGGRQLHVLVVDDATLNRRMLTRLLLGKFESIREAVDGSDAVSQVKESLVKGQPPINIILMDYFMPNKDGPTAAKEIRELGFTGIIIGVTGNTQQDDIDRFMFQGADCVLLKPVDATDLESTISGREFYIN